MVLKSNLFFLAILFVFNYSIAQSNSHSINDIDSVDRFRLSFPVIILSNIGSGGERTNTQHIELHFKYNLDSKNIIGIKFATWRLFQPMGILWWDGLLDKIKTQTEFYPGYLRETGLGITYQRMLWKALFATVEVLPLYKTYLDSDKNKIANEFKLYKSLHLGYHISLGKKKRFFIEPQIHSQIWVFDTNTPDGFKELDDKWRNYFLFEPNLYLGVKF